MKSSVFLVAFSIAVAPALAAFATPYQDLDRINDIVFLAIDIYVVDLGDDVLDFGVGFSESGSRNASPARIPSCTAICNSHNINCHNDFMEYHPVLMACHGPWLPWYANMPSHALLSHGTTGEIGRAI